MFSKKRNWWLWKSFLQAIRLMNVDNVAVKVKSNLNPRLESIRKAHARKRKSRTAPSPMSLQPPLLPPSPARQNSLPTPPPPHFSPPISRGSQAAERFSSFSIAAATAAALKRDSQAAESAAIRHALALLDPDAKRLRTASSPPLLSVGSDRSDPFATAAAVAATTHNLVPMAVRDSQDAVSSRRNMRGTERHLSEARSGAVAAGIVDEGALGLELLEEATAQLERAQQLSADQVIQVGCLASAV